MDVVLGPGEVVQPDLFVLLGDPSRKVEGSFKGTPDLAVEIVSPSSFRRDNVEKRALYARFGVQEYWLVDPAHRVIEVNRLQDGAYVLHAMAIDAEGEPDTVTSALLPDLRATLAEVFHS